MNNILQFVWFKDLTNWSVNNYLSINNINTKYNLVKIYELLKQVKNQEILKDETNYKLSGIHSHGKGLFHRNIKLGKDIKGKTLNKLQKNQFLYSRLGSHTGSFDLVSDEFNNYYVSNEVPTFEFINNNINPYYLQLVFLLKKYWQDIEKSLQGTAHKRFKEKDFLNLQIPLPPLKIQQQLVKNYQEKINIAKQQEQEAEQKIQEIETYLYKELGIELPKEEQQNKDILQFINFKDLHYWSYGQIITTNNFNCDYQIKNFDNICDFKNKRFDKNKYDNVYFNYIDIGSIDTLKGITGIKKIKLKNAPSRATQCINKGDLIIATTRPYLKKFAIVDDSFNNDVCSSGFSVIQFNPDKYNLFYIKEFLQSYYGIEQLKSNMTVGLYPAITLKKLKEIKFPLPPIEIQNKIANYIQNIKNEIQILKQQAEQNKKMALNEFETKIFTNKDSTGDNNAT
jgi:restriction endonuclease S subunit